MRFLCIGLSILLASICLIGCVQHEQPGSLAEAAMDGKAPGATPSEQGVENSVNPLACQLFANYSASLLEIGHRAESVIVGNDSCVLGICDTVVSSYVRTREVKYLTVFDSLCEHADGYVAEYITSCVGELLRTAPNEFIEYASMRGQDAKLSTHLIMYLRNIAHAMKTSPPTSIGYLEAQETRKIVEQLEHSLSAQQWRYLQWAISEADHAEAG